MEPNSLLFVTGLRVLSESELFCELDEEFLGNRLISFTHRTVSRGAVAMTAEQTDREFCVILRGRVRLVANGPCLGRDLTLMLLEPGDAFDVVALLDGRPHNLSAEAIERVELLCIPIDQMRQWIKDNPNFNRRFLPYVGRLMAHLAELASDLALQDTGTRLAKLILRHTDLHAESGPATVRLINDLSNEKLASMIGSVRLVVSRQLNNLRGKGIIDSNRKMMAVREIEKLKSIVNGLELEPIDPQQEIDPSTCNDQLG